MPTLQRDPYTPARTPEQCPNQAAAILVPRLQTLLYTPERLTAGACAFSGAIACLHPHSPASDPGRRRSRRLGIDPRTVSSQLMRFRQLIELHDPDGQWITRVRLGIGYRPQGTCPFCGHGGQLKSSGFDGAGRRKVRCPECSRIWPISRDDAGTQVAVRIAHDPALTAARRRRR